MARFDEPSSCSSGHCGPGNTEKAKPCPVPPVGREETASERGARYMWLIEAQRTGMQDDIRAMRKPSDGIRSRSSCDTIIDMAVLHVAQDTLVEHRDYTANEVDALTLAVKEKIITQLASKADKGYALGE